MAFTKDWRPEDWEQIKKNIVTETPIVFSPSTGYDKGHQDILIEKMISAVLGALAAVIVPPTGE